MRDSRNDNGAGTQSDATLSAQSLRARLRRAGDLIPESGVGAGGLALTDQVVVSAGNFITGVIIGRFCTQREFGLYMLGLTIAAIAVQLQKSLISTPFMVYSPRLRGRALASYTGSTLIHQSGVSLLAVVLLLLTGAAASSGLGPEGLAPVIWALAISIAFILFREFVRNVCFSELRFFVALVLDSLAVTVQIIGFLLLAVAGRLSADIAFLIAGGACGLTGGAWLIQSRKTLLVQLGCIATDFKRNWTFGKWIVAGSVLWQASVQLYPWFLTVFHGPESAGVWAACIGVVGIANPVLIATQNYIGPRIAHAYSRGGSTQLRRLVAKTGLLFSILVLPIVIGLGFLGGWLVPFIYGESYAGYGNVLAVLAVNLLLLQYQVILSTAVVTVGRVDLELATNVVSLLVFCFLGWWLVSEFGPIGAAYGTLASGFALTLTKYVAYGLAVRRVSKD